MNDTIYDEFLEEDTQKDKYLIFKIEEESYGIDIKYVTEIIGIQSITPVPELPEYIRGIINLRGIIIPVMDIRVRFKMPQKDYNDRTCIIVIDVENISIGLIIDTVSEVITIEEDNIVQPPENTMISNKYIKGIGKVDDEVKLLLDCRRILGEEEIDSIKINLDYEEIKTWKLRIGITT